MILSDAAKPGGRQPVRIEDVAREAGVSPITVSRALSAPHKVKKETRDRVMAAVEKTGYVINTIASSLRSGRSSIVTVFVASLQNPHFAAALQGALDAFEGSRYSLVFAQTGYKGPADNRIVEIVRPSRPAAVMLTGIPLHESARSALRDLGVPVIEVWCDGGEPIDMVAGASIRDGVELMGRHIAEQGYRNIAYCGQTSLPGGVGLEGFRAGLESGGARLGHVHAVEGTGTLSAGMAALNAIVDAYPACDAVYFGSDLLAVGATIAARDRGIEIPGQLAVAGFGDLDFASHTRPTLTTISVSDYETGLLAGGAMRRRLEGGLVIERVIQVPMRLIARESTPPRSKD